MVAYRKAVHAVVLASALALTLILSGCPPDEPPAKKKTTLAGVIELPPGARLENVAVAALKSDKEVAQAAVNPDTGKYLVNLPGPGRYNLRLKTPKGNLDFAAGIDAAQGQQATVEPFPAPVDLFEEPSPPPDHNVEPPQPPPAPTPPATTELKPPVTDPEHAGQSLATISGKVHPAEAQVKLLSNGEIVAQGAAVDGVFEIPSVPAGLYDVEYAAPGYTAVFQENVAVTEQGPMKKLTAFLLYVSPLDGVDWDAGTVTATGLGKAPPNMTAPQSLLMACQGAKTVAYRNLLNTILNVQVEPGKTIAAMDKEGNFKSQLRGFVQGAKTLKETKNSDGTCEITLQAPLKGKNSVSSFAQTKLGD